MFFVYHAKVEKNRELMCMISFTYMLFFLFIDIDTFNN